ncbi:phage tail protein [Citrobacter freundii complex sp. 2023EL-00966]|uniref:phage tail fiber protein n=1 Tax=Citrobacter freundii complex sp. 2023EL-00966 TaxID=3076118 RepID=UPI0028961FDF|nr:phage tail protein [Citrobacter freundii complex sp. 2023EL-00966]MDT3751451.1 phage tail protein [Citrobacter freundii complex sp. 2023EL-00966]
MSAGTLTLTNNSAAVAGNGTAFTTEVAAGDFIVVTVGGVPYTLPVKSVESGTALTLVSNFTGPTQSGAAWSAVPRVALNMVTAALVTQSAEALRGLNYDKQNWQQVFSASGMITVKLPDGSSFPGPSWKYLADNMATKSGGAVPVNQGGTGSTDAAGARKNLGLGSAAILDAGPDIGKVMTVGFNSVGIGSVNDAGLPALYNYNRTDIPRGIYTGDPTGPGAPGSSGGAIVLIMNGSYGFQLAKQNLHSALQYRECRAGAFSDWWTLYSSGNTTMASDGTLKVASPVVKLFADGSAETNEESQGVTVTRQAVGEYLIKGCIGLNADAAWGGIDGGFDIPKDRNRQPLIWLDYKVNPDGSVLVKTFHRTYHNAPEFARNLIGVKDDAGGFTESIKNGDPIDIPADQYVSVRVEMPSDSLWNKMQKEARAAMEKAERERQQNQQDTQS